MNKSFNLNYQVVMFPVLVSTNGRFIKHSGVEIKHRKPLKLIFEDECRLIFDAKL